MARSASPKSCGLMLACGKAWTPLASVPSGIDFRSAENRPRLPQRERNDVSATNAGHKPRSTRATQVRHDRRIAPRRGPRLRASGRTRVRRAALLRRRRSHARQWRDRATHRAAALHRFAPDLYPLVHRPSLLRGAVTALSAGHERNRDEQRASTRPRPPRHRASCHAGRSGPRARHRRADCARPQRHGVLGIRPLASRGRPFLGCRHSRLAAAIGGGTRPHRRLAGRGAHDPARRAGRRAAGACAAPARLAAARRATLPAPRLRGVLRGMASTHQRPRHPPAHRGDTISVVLGIGVLASEYDAVRLAADVGPLLLDASTRIATALSGAPDTAFPHPPASGPSRSAHPP